MKTFRGMCIEETMSTSPKILCKQEVKTILIGLPRVETFLFYIHDAYDTLNISELSTVAEIIT